MIAIENRREMPIDITTMMITVIPTHITGRGRNGSLGLVSYLILIDGERTAIRLLPMPIVP
jgi:hypothetical protein